MSDEVFSILSGDVKTVSLMVVLRAFLRCIAVLTVVKDVLSICESMALISKPVVAFSMVVPVKLF